MEDKTIYDLTGKIWIAISAVQKDIAVIRHEIDDLKEDIRILHARVNDMTNNAMNNRKMKSDKVNRIMVALIGGSFALLVVLIDVIIPMLSNND